MMMISSLVETWGWGTPLMPEGGNTVVEVVVAASELVDDSASLAEAVILWSGSTEDIRKAIASSKPFHPIWKTKLTKLRSKLRDAILCNFVSFYNLNSCKSSDVSKQGHQGPWLEHTIFVAFICVFIFLLWENGYIYVSFIYVQKTMTPRHIINFEMC